MPSMLYGLSSKNQYLVVVKAKSKKDGIYSMNGVTYRVRDGKVTHFACCSSGNILVGYGHINVVVGHVETGTGFQDRAREALKAVK